MGNMTLNSLVGFVVLGSYTHVCLHMSDGPLKKQLTTHYYLWHVYFVSCTLRVLSKREIMVNKIHLILAFTELRV